MKPKKTFVVDRAKWRCGGGLTVSGEGLPRLLNQEGFMCCLGFASQQCGVPKKRLLGIGMPGDLYLPDRERVAFLMEREADERMVQNIASSINDDYKLSHKERERKLSALFRKHGYAMKFVGRYPKAVKS